MTESQGTMDGDTLRLLLAALHADAQRVGDSPLRADRLIPRIEAARESLASVTLTDEQLARISAALDDAVRVLRREEDGREAGRHLQTAQRQLEGRSPRPSPFLDDF